MVWEAASSSEEASKAALSESLSTLTLTGARSRDVVRGLDAGSYATWLCGVYAVSIFLGYRESEASLLDGRRMFCALALVIAGRRGAVANGANVVFLLLDGARWYTLG